MATSVNNIRTSLNDRLVERQDRIAEEIRKLEARQRYYGDAVQAFSELLPNLENPLSKLHLELVGVNVNFGKEGPDGEFMGSLEVRTVQGFRYLVKSSNSNRNYTKLSDKAMRMASSLFCALQPYGVNWVNINPFSLQGGIGGYRVGDIFDIQIIIKK